MFWNWKILKKKMTVMHRWLLGGSVNGLATLATRWQRAGNAGNALATLATRWQRWHESSPMFFCRSTREKMKENERKWKKMNSKSERRWALPANWWRWSFTWLKRSPIGRLVVIFQFIRPSGDLMENFQQSSFWKSPIHSVWWAEFDETATSRVRRVASTLSSFWTKSIG